MIDRENRSDGFAVLTLLAAADGSLDAAQKANFAQSIKALLDGGEARGIIIHLATGTAPAADALSALRDLHDQSAEAVLAHLAPFRAALRLMETSGKPTIAAIGSSLNGEALEIALACHRRVVTTEAEVAFGFAETNYGLMPGAGGTQRLPRLLGVATALPVLNGSKTLDLTTARKLGLVDAQSTLDDSMAWATATPKAQRPWDLPAFAPPGGGASSPELHNYFIGANALLHARTQGNEHAPHAIQSAVFEGIRVPFDTALNIEAKWHAHLLVSDQAGDMLALALATTTAAQPALAERWRIAYIAEGLAMIAAGLPAALVENGARAAGFAETPLTLADRIGPAALASIIEAPTAPILALLTKFSETGFYTGPDGEKRLNRDLTANVAQDAAAFDIESVKQRLLGAQATAAQRALSDGTVASAGDANIVSLLAGFPRYTGGAATFAERLRRPEFSAPNTSDAA